jgi:hypothetical protein
MSTKTSSKPWRFGKITFPNRAAEASFLNMVEKIGRVRSDGTRIGGDHIFRKPQDKKES